MGGRVDDLAAQAPATATVEQIAVRRVAASIATSH
jgi:hypothetical protein